MFNNQMAKKCVLMLLLSLMMFIPAGCGKKGDEIIPTDSSGASQTTLWEKPEPEDIKYPSKPADDLMLITAEDYDFVIYKNLSSSRTISFFILTSKQIEDGSTAEIDINTTYNYNIFLMPDGNLKEDGSKYISSDLFDCYQGMDWKLMLSLYKEAMKGEDGVLTEAKELYNDYNMQYSDYWLQMDENNIPNLYLYRVTISFNVNESNLTENELINEITLNINGKEHKLNIGRIILDYETENIFSNEGITPKCNSVYDFGFYPNSEGKITIDAFSFTNIDDLKITGFRLLNNDAEITDVSLDITTGNGSYNTVWTGEPMVVTKLAYITPRITVAIKGMAEKITYNTSLIIVMDYEISGVKHSICFFASVMRLPNMYELYAVEIDGVDVISYYNDYLIYESAYVS